MREKGFTLIEIAVVIAIVMTLITLGLSVVTSQLTAGAYSATKKRQELIKDALIAYLGSNKRLPCPYPPTAGGLVTGDAPAQTGSPPACPVIGIVPFSTLGISSENAMDSWGNYFTYRVYTNAIPCPAGWDWGNSSCFGEGKNGITPPFLPAQSVRDGTITTFSLLTDKSIAIVVSHGPNGLGAWAAQGTRNAAPTTCEESHNAFGTTPPVGCVVMANMLYKGEREGNDDVVAYMSASDALQTLVAQKAIKSAPAKVSDDLQTLLDAAVGTKRSNVVYGGVPDPNCATSVLTSSEMNALLGSMRDPWGGAYLINEGPGTFPICIYSQGGGSTTCLGTAGGCVWSPPVICKSIDKVTFNGYMAKSGSATCP